MDTFAIQMTDGGDGRLCDAGYTMYSLYRQASVRRLFHAGNAVTLSEVFQLF